MIRLFFGILVSTQRCIAVQEIVEDHKVFFIPDICLTKATSDSYAISFDTINKLMLFGRNSLSQNQCLAIYLDSYNLPEKTGFLAFFQTISSPRKEASALLKKTLISSGSDSIIKTNSIRFNHAEPVCSICKYEDKKKVYLGILTINYNDGQSIEVFALSSIVTNTLQYSKNFNARYD